MKRNKSVLTVQMKAGDCAFYHHRHPDTGESLEAQGVLPYANAPPEFEPDLNRLASDTKSLAALAQAIEGYDESQLRIAMHTLWRSHQLLKHGLRFGQVVFKNLSTPHRDYLDCWFRCYVIGLAPVYAGVQYVYLTGELEDARGSLITVPIESFMERPEFTRHRKHLISNARTRTPRGVRQGAIVHRDPLASFEDFPSIAEVAERLAVEQGSIRQRPTREAATQPRTNRAPRKRALDEITSFKVI